MRGAQREAFHEISLEMAAQGCLATCVCELSCHMMSDTWSHWNSPAEQNDDGIAFSGDKPKHENVFAAAIVTFWRGFSQGALRVQNDFLVFSAHEMVDDMGGRCIASRIAEPLGADQTLDDRGRRVNATVTKISYQ